MIGVSSGPKSPHNPAAKEKPGAANGCYPEERYKSIIDIDPSSLMSIPMFTENATLKAMNKLGYHPVDLVRLSFMAMERIPGMGEVKERICDEIEKRRLKAFAMIVAERNKIIENEKRGDLHREKPAVGEVDRAIAKEEEIFEKIKRNKLQHLVDYQMNRKKANETEERDRRKVKKAMEERINEIKKHKMEEELKILDAKKRKERRLMEEKMKNDELLKKYDGSSNDGESIKKARCMVIWKKPDEKLSKKLILKELKTNDMIVAEEIKEKLIRKQEIAMKIVEQNKAEKISKIKSKSKEDDHLIALKQQSIIERDDKRYREQLVQMTQKELAAEMLLKEKRAERERMIAERKERQKQAIIAAQMRRKEIEKTRKSRFSNSGREIEMVIQKKRAQSQQYLLTLREHRDKESKKMAFIIEKKKAQEEQMQQKALSLLTSSEKAMMRSHEIVSKKYQLIQSIASKESLKRKRGEEKAKMIEAQDFNKRKAILEKSEQKLQSIEEKKKQLQIEHMKKQDKLKKLRLDYSYRIKEIEAEIEKNPDISAEEISMKLGIK